MSESKNNTEANKSNPLVEGVKRFFDVPVHVTIELANRNMKVRDILQLQPSSIVELPKSAGENVDILVNDRPIATGEVLELDGATGVRLTDFNTIQ